MPSPSARSAKTSAEIACARLARQLHGTATDPAEIVRTYGAVQAQDYRAALWALGLRTQDASEADVERAASERAIVRTWPMRGTLHFVAAEDARWMVRLLAPRVVSSAGARYRQLELDAPAFAKARRVIEAALAGGRNETRPELFARLERAGIATGAQRGVHILSWLCMHGVLCGAGHSGKQPTFALLEEWVRTSRDLEGDEALAELSRRYFTAHGPASAQDFAWWTGLPLGAAKRAIEAAGQAIDVVMKLDGMYASGPQPAWAERSPVVHLLPVYDEYAVAYRDRSAFLDPQHAERARGGIMSPVILVDGRIAGVWSRTTHPSRVAVRVEALARWSDPVRKAVRRAADRYGRFLGKVCEIEVSSGAR